MRLTFLITTVLLLFHGCGYRFVNAETERLDFKSISIFNLTTDARVTVLVRQELDALLRKSTTTSETLRVVVRQNGADLVGLDTAGAASVEGVRVQLQFDVYLGDKIQHRLEPIELMQSYMIGQSVLQSRLAREEAYRRAIRDGIVMGVQRLRRYRKQGQ
jgi:hypothetical protein